MSRLEGCGRFRARRPWSLAQVAARAVDGSSFEFELADFLHEFARCGNIGMLTEAPVLLRGVCELGAVYDAYLAAVAVSLSAKLAFRERNLFVSANALSVV